MFTEATLFDEQIFSSKKRLPEGAQVIVVSDMFADEYVGGAELTTQAVIDSSPLRVHRVKSRDLTLEMLEQGNQMFWVFGNFAEMNSQLIPSIIANLKYTVLEYDYKYCRFRSPEKHLESTKTPCDCHNQLSGKMVSAFYYGSMGLWWMSEKQKERYTTMFPFLLEKDNVVLSSVFDAKTLGVIEHLKSNAPVDRNGWIVLGSSSWVKGFSAAEKWCKDNSKEHEIVWNVPYDQLLLKLSRAEGFVYLPAGADTCPRMVIEAKLLGCKLVLNDNVQHRKEDWFDTDDLESIKDYLWTATKIFWSGVKRMMDYRPKISGYTTTFNCVKQQYPFIQCIQSMLGFCDEVCIVDGGSNDDTLQHLAAIAYPGLSFVDGCDLDVISGIASVPGATFDFPDEWRGVKKDPRLKVKIVFRDWSHPRRAVYDGMQKAAARDMCTGDFCWQMDSDEIVHEDDYEKARDITRHIPSGVDVLSLPVIEGWGSWDKIRLDVTPWKWRLSRNNPDVTHGIPIDLRAQDDTGHLIALEGTDGCDMVSRSTGERVPHVSFYTPDIDAARRAALGGNQQSLAVYEGWFNSAVSQLPSVFHYSWIDISRKIKLYRDYWQSHWTELIGKNTADTAENNMFFDCPWSTVTDEMISARAKELAENTGGHIWHSKWNGQKTPHITCSRSQPKVMSK